MRVRAKQLIGQLLVGESCKKSAGWDCNCYYWTPRWKLEQAAKTLGFKPRYRYAPELTADEHLVINNFAGGLCIYDGKQMDQAKFDRELARINSVSESVQAKKSWEQGSTMDYYCFSPSAVKTASANLGFHSRIVPSIAATAAIDTLSDSDIVVMTRKAYVFIVNGRSMDREKFDRELSRLSTVSESKEQWAQPDNWFSLSNDSHWNTDPRVLVAAAKSLGFTADRPVDSWTPPTVDEDDLVLLNASRVVIVTGGASMDKDKFDREVARLSAVQEAATDYGFPQEGPWTVRSKTIRLYSQANARHVHTALKNMGIEPVRYDAFATTPKRVIELRYHAIAIPDSAEFDFGRFARELARARSSSE